MQLLVGGSSKETGALLREYLADRGGSAGGATVCYGAPTTRQPNLNGACGSGKVERMQLFTKAGVRTVPWWNGEGRIPDGMTFPLLARNSYGYGGTDIVPVFQPQEIDWRLKAGFSWFSQYIPVATEYRVWTFRGHLLDCYEKVMRRPNDYRFIGRNFRNGFDFVHIGDGPADAFKEAAKATSAIGLDFAAVDLLRGLNGNVYVLEANSAPGVIASGAQRTLAKLADHIIQWEKKGYPNA